MPDYNEHENGRVVHVATCNCPRCRKWPVEKEQDDAG